MNAWAQALSRPALALAFLVPALASPCHAQDAPPPDRRNWWGDPFFQLSSHVPGCPVPLGPLRTEQERDAQSHNRAERGTTCWLAGACARPNFYLYDPDVAAAVRQRAAARPRLFAGTSLWITVRGRVVFVDGCVSARATADALDAFMREVPDVAQVVVRVRVPGDRQVPYPVALPASAVR